MPGYLLVLAAILAGQVNSANDPYGASGQSQAGADNQPASQSNEGLVPILQPPPGEPRSPPGATPSSRNSADPYGTSARESAAAAGGNQPTAPFGNPATPSRSAPPPGYSQFQSQATQPAAATPPASSASRIKPSALMRSMLTAPAASRLTGQSVRLAEVIAGATSRMEQSQRIGAYWDLCSSVADYYLGLTEQDELRRLRATVPRIGATWEQAEKELAVRIGTSERAARASQHRLASWGGYLGSLPLPGDIPHCGNYHSHYDEIFAGRPSTEAQELSALLPLRYAELKDAALAVSRAEEWLNAIASVRNEDSDGTGTLRALELLALRRRAFVQIARDYNRRIARYSELATPGQVAAERLVGMLILRDGSSTATRTSSPTSPPDRQSSSEGANGQRTFSGGWSPAAPNTMTGARRDDAVQPTSAESPNAPRQERSLLVKPQ